MSHTAVINEELVREKVKGLQAKLLNFSLRNKLLNFSHKERTRGFVRVVDELPNTLYRTLSEKWMETLPLPDIPKEEDSEEFTQALEQFRLTSIEYDRKLDELGDEVDAADQLEEWLRKEVRDKLGIRANTKARISLSDHARQHGIKPDFELPRDSPTGSAEKWIDDRIQLLLTPDAAERRLGQLLDLSNQSQKEQGVNTLFAAFGFLQWKEDDSSDRLLQAPLLLVPLQIKREIKDHEYRYRFTTEGSDSQVNQTLKERLRRDLGVHLPELGEDETPETYWAAVQGLIETRRGWRVNRWVSFGIFPFGKMAMYKDLDPSSWPEDSPLCQHPLLQDVLLGQEDSGDSDETASGACSTDEYDRNAPLLITDCDSSQFAAIARCLGKKSAVIQGPPGTGKSQTITNLIASALARGESVLFVAEKMAALQVVSSRLGEAGLGPFMLELHSDNVLKSEVMASLQARTQLLPGRTDNERWGDQLRRLNGTRAELNAYSELMNSTFGQTGLKVHDILWGRMARAATYSDVPATLLAQLIEDPPTWSKEKRDRADELARSIVASVGILHAGGTSIGENPWRGLQPRLRAPAELMEAKAWLDEHLLLLQATATSISRVRDILPELPSEFLHPALTSLLQAIVSVGAPPKSMGLIADSEAHLEGMDRWRALSELMRHQSATSLAVKRNCARADKARELKPLMASFEGRVGDLPVRLASLRKLKTAIGAIQRHHSELAEISSDLAELSLVKIRLLLRASKLATSLSLPARKERKNLRFDGSSARVVVQMKSALKEVLEKEEQLASELKLDNEISDEVLRNIETEIRDSHILSWLSSTYRNAHRQFVSLYCGGSKLDRNKKADLIQRLLRLREQERSFHGDATFRGQFGALFAGRKSDVGLLDELASFEERVEQSLTGLSPLIRQLKRTLYEAPDDVFAFLQELDSSGILELDLEISDDQQPLSAYLLEIEDEIQRLDELRVGLLAFDEVSDGLLISSLVDLADDIQRYNDIESTLRNSPLLHRLFPGGLSVEYCEHSVLEVSASYVDACNENKLGTTFITAMFGLEGANFYQVAINDIRAASGALTKLDENWDTFATRELDDRKKFLDGREYSNLSLEKRRARWQQCSETQHLMGEFAKLRESLEGLAQLGLRRVVEHAEQEETWLQRLDEVVSLSIWTGMANAVHNIDNKLLTRHRGADHEELQKRFKGLDRELLQLNRYELGRRLLANPIPRGVSRGKVGDKTDLALIEHEAGKQKRHIPLRELIRRAGNALQAMKPCFMMSPLSVSQFLTPGQLKFDLLIIDEASQMTPEDSMSAIGRCGRMVVVGDPQQLPPTNFFGKKFDEDSDEDEEAVDSEAVLDLAQGVYSPVVDLRWHYRSKMASLITFSNHNFYDNRLQVFPSPKESSKHWGVKLFRVAGVYGNSLNPIEAEALIEHVLRLMKDHPDKSIGVVALNQKQREYIHELFEKRMAEDDLAVEYEQKWSGTLEPFFVKNLENVQGDERDIIVISTVYGPDEKGTVMQRFGPINSKTGHRRLNVLFTRAKFSTQVFTSMSPHDIKVKEGTSSRGVIALKDYLAYAETGKLQDYHLTGREPDSDFEVSVAKDLAQLGYQVSAQIGAGGYFVDLGVHHPKHPHRFAAGIECDGASYHSGKYARDRDRLRQEVLEGLGWNIIRIWSTDYFRNPQETIQRVSKEIQDILKGQRQK